MTDLSKAIRVFRERHGIKQEDMAVRLGVSQASVSLWEKGAVRPAPRTEARIRRMIEESPAHTAERQMEMFVRQSPQALLLLRVQHHRITPVAHSITYPVAYWNGGPVAEYFIETHLRDIRRNSNTFLGSHFTFLVPERNEFHKIKMSFMRFGDEAMIVAEPEEVRAISVEDRVPLHGIYEPLFSKT